MSVGGERPHWATLPTGAAAIVAMYGSAVAISGERLNLLGREDALIESAGAACFAGAALAFLAASLSAARGARQSPGGRSRRPQIYCALALLMFICCGEEISWGQRLLGWQAPRFFAAHNAQGETNLHNLRPVHQWNPDGTEKAFAAKLVNLNRLFSIFWLAVFVFLPAAAAAAPRLRATLAAAGLPVPPLWAGGLFLTTYATYKVLAFVHAGTIRAHALDELKEASYAAIYLGIAFAALAAERSRTSAVERRPGARGGADAGGGA
jgi:hypothetical protein